MIQALAQALQTSVSLGKCICIQFIKELCPPEERDSVDPFGLGVGGHLGPQGRAHGLQQVRAVVQGTRRAAIPEELPQARAQRRRQLRLCHESVQTAATVKQFHKHSFAQHWGRVVCGHVFGLTE